MSISDWSKGADGIAFQTCDSCNAVWYFHRSFCPGCGKGEPVTRQASGLGTLHARTLVSRASSEELRAHVPYLIVLVDAAEGFRLMAHGDPALAIGDKVRAKFIQLAGKKIPYFDKA